MLAAHDGEIREGGFGHGGDFYIFDFCCGRALAAPGDEGLDRCLGTGDYGFDVAGGSVFYPSGQGEFDRLIFGAGAVVDALDFAFYE